MMLLLIFSGCSKDKPDQASFDDARAVAEGVREDNLMQWVEQLAAVHLYDTPIDNSDFPPGDLFPSDHLTRDSATGFVAGVFKKMSYDPDTLVLGEGTYATYNVFAEWPGTTKPDEVILVGCHHDAFYGGADDNGSAVAAMLEAARVVRDHLFARTIRFISFDLEEFGAIGSTRYVQAGYADDVHSAIVMDCIGYHSFEPGSQKNVMGVTLPDVGDYLMIIGNKNSADLVQQSVALANGHNLSKSYGLIAPGDGMYFLASAFSRSDHGLLWYQGVPAIFLSDGANFRNPYYHTEDDLPENLDPEFLTGNTKVLIATIALLAEVQP
jgi:Zn-dependent M28 family amino/carboxypeptidase